MGHSIQHYEFSIKESKERIESIVNEDCRMYSDTDGGLYTPIRFLDNRIYEDEQEAYEAIERLDKNWYDQLAVQYKAREKREDTKAIINLRERIKKLEEDFQVYIEKNSIKNRKSDFVGCPNCGSKINVTYIESRYSKQWNTCPLCSQSLTSKSVSDSIFNKETKITELKKELENKIRDNNRKGKHEVKWLVKTEYHV